MNELISLYLGETLQCELYKVSDERKRKVHKKNYGERERNIEN